MKKRKNPILANKFFVRAGVNFYAKKYCKKQVKLTYSADLSKIKPPYVVVANHSGFLDVCGLIRMLYPNCANFVISVTQIVKWPKAIKYMGILPKKQFTVDTSLIRDIKYVLSKKRPVAIYPEAKLSVVGTPNIIKPAIAKLIKLLKVPLVTVRFDGAYLHKPRWAKDKRYLPVYADVQVAVTADEIVNISVDEIHKRIVENLSYDDYAYQLKNGIEIESPTLCEGLEHILYKCPCCNEEFAITAKGNALTCSKCGATVMQNKLGQLEGGKFDKVTDWYEWQRECVKDELQNQTYGFCDTFRAEKLVKKDYVDIGEAKITHNEQGIFAKFGDKELFYKAGLFYTLSFNNEFIYLPAEEAVYRFRRLNNVGSTTKLNLAIEEQTKLIESSNK